MEVYSVTVATGTSEYSGTNNYIFVTLVGEKGESERTLLDNPGLDFCRGAVSGHVITLWPVCCSAIHCDCQGFMLRWSIYHLELLFPVLLLRSGLLPVTLKQSSVWVLMVIWDFKPTQHRPPVVVSLVLYYCYHHSSGCVLQQRAHRLWKTVQKIFDLNTNGQSQCPTLVIKQKVACLPQLGQQITQPPIKTTRSWTISMICFHNVITESPSSTHFTHQTFLKNGNCLTGP